MTLRRSLLIFGSLLTVSGWHGEAAAVPINLEGLTGTFNVPGNPPGNVEISHALFQSVFGRVQALAAGLQPGQSAVINIGIYNNTQFGSHTNEFSFQARQPHFDRFGTMVTEQTELNLFRAYSEPRAAMDAFLNGNNVPGNCGENALPEVHPARPTPTGQQGRLVGTLSFTIRNANGRINIRLLNMCGTCSAGHAYLIDFAAFLRGTATEALTHLEVPGTGRVPIPEFPGGNPTAYPTDQALVRRAYLDLFRRFLGDDFTFASPDGLPNLAEVARLERAIETGEGNRATCSTTRAMNRARLARICRGCGQIAGPVVGTVVFMAIAQAADIYIGPGTGLGLGAGALGLGFYFNAGATARFMGPQVAAAIIDHGSHYLGCPEEISMGAGVATAGGIGACIGGPPGAVTAAAVYASARFMGEVGKLLEVHVEGGRIMDRAVDAAVERGKRRCLSAIMNCRQPPNAAARDGLCRFDNHHHHFIETMGNQLTVTGARGASADFKGPAMETLRAEMRRQLDDIRAQRRRAEELTRPRDIFQDPFLRDLNRLNRAFSLPCDGSTTPPRRPNFGTGLRPVFGTGNNAGGFGVDDTQWVPGRGPVRCEGGNCLVPTSDGDVLDLCVDGRCPTNRCRLLRTATRRGQPVGDGLENLMLSRWSEPMDDGQDGAMLQVEREMERLTDPANFERELGTFLGQMCAARPRDPAGPDNRLDPARCDPCEGR